MDGLKVSKEAMRELLQAFGYPTSAVQLSHQPDRTNYADQESKVAARRAALRRALRTFVEKE